MKIVVTGGSGRLGSRLLVDLIEHGYDVLSVDQKKPTQEICKTVAVNLQNLGEVFEVMKGADAVIHLGAIPGLSGFSDDTIFRNNVLGTYHVLEAASTLGIRKAVIASSESSYGFFWAPREFSPKFLPVDETHPQLAQEAYGLSKILNENTAAMYERCYGMQVVALRFSRIIGPELYPDLVKHFAHPEILKRNLWSYVDVRDAATACRISLEVEGLGAVAINIAADETLANVQSNKLIQNFYPEIHDIRTPFQGFESLVSNQKAKELINWQPVHSWKESV